MRPGAGPAFRLPARRAANNDDGGAYDIFVRKRLMPPVWIPPERVELIVDIGAGVGMSCLWWLANYWRARVVAFEADRSCAAHARANIALNGYQSRIDLYEPPVAPELAMDSVPDWAGNWIGGAPADFFASLAGRRIDVLKMDASGSGYDLLADERFGSLDVRTVAVRCQGGVGGRERCLAQLQKLGLRAYSGATPGASGMVWGYEGSGRSLLSRPRKHGPRC